MKIVVCVKQLPDPAEPGRMDGDRLDRVGKLIMDDADRYGVEVGLQVAGEEGEVVLVSMAPRPEMGDLRQGLAMGAARAVVICDDALAGSDALGTAKVLAAAIAREEPDLVVTATESTDGYTGTVPVQVAELLGWPAVSYARSVAVVRSAAEVRSATEVRSAAGGMLRAERQTESGYEEVEVGLPAVVSVTAGVVEPRYPNFRGITGAAKKPVEVLSVVDLGVDPGSVGVAGARQEIVSVEPAPVRTGGQIVVDDGTAHERIVALLEELRL